MSDFFAEKLITTVAFISFTFILLIFIFVFRETIPIFSGAEQTTSNIAEDEVQETYGEEPAVSDEQGAGSLERRALSGERGEITNSKPETSPAGGGQATRETPEDSYQSFESEGNANFENLTSTKWQPISDEPKFGLLPLIIGSFKVTFIAILFATPIAILAALFTSAFAPKWAQEIMKPTIEILAGFPSVVIGFFALIVMATVFQDIFGFEYRLNAFLGGVALSLAVIPIIYTITEDALSRVPKSLTEASLALGATKWQTALFVILPAATPGVFAAILLGIGRAFGETMIVLMATGNAAMFSGSFFEPVRTMSATIGAEMAEVVFGETHYNVLFFIGAVLFIFTFSLNAIAEIFIRQRLMKKYGGL
ncbi:MAG: phosphate ABC transporter permease subunit PstC [Ignavibacteriae bacterium]|nr:phosphate ABC transporter permease subunit PstC [Ignavibacteriota bacterium]